MSRASPDRVPDTPTHPAPATELTMTKPRREPRDPGLHRGGDPAELPRLRDVRHRRARAPRRPRRPEARPPPRPLRDVGAGEPRTTALQEVGPHRRRRHGEVPPPRRRRDLRHDRPDGAGLLHAGAARGRPGELRLRGRRRRGGDALHRDPADPPRRGDARRRHRQGDRRLDAQLRRLPRGADGPARRRSRTFS